MAECAHCGDDIDDPYECPECGEVFCSDHDKPLLHDCSSVSIQGSGPVAPDIDDEQSGWDPEKEESSRSESSTGKDSTDDSTDDSTGDDPAEEDSTDDTVGTSIGESMGIESTDVSSAESMPVCDFCDEKIDPPPNECPGCDNTFCDEHTRPIHHNCPTLETGGIATDSEEEEDDWIGPGTFLTQIVVVAVLLLLVVALGTGIVTPPGFLGGGGGGDGGGGGPPTPGDAPAFDESAFRGVVFDWVNEQRRSAGAGTLSVDRSRQTVANAIATDMAKFNFFQNDSAPESPRFNVSKRLEQAGASCAADGGATARSFILRTYYNRRVKIEGKDEVQIYSNTSEVGQAAIGQMEDGRGIGPILSSDKLSNHAMGVHIDEDNVVYVVYLAC